VSGALHDLFLPLPPRPPVDPPAPDRRPARARVAWDEIDGRVVLALPRPLSWAERLVSRLLFPIPAERLVSLEGPAARFWLLADGARTLRGIAAAMGADPARCARFADDLAARGLLAPEGEAADDALRGLTPARGWRRVACRRCRTTQPVRAGPGARWFCPRCRKLNQVPTAP
jgi:hypothetical protein